MKKETDKLEPRVKRLEGISLTLVHLNQLISRRQDEYEKTLRRMARRMDGSDHGDT